MRQFVSLQVACVVVSRETEGLQSKYNIGVTSQPACYW